jgi:hypothetical protein
MDELRRYKKEKQGRFYTENDNQQNHKEHFRYPNEIVSGSASPTHYYHRFVPNNSTKATHTHSDSHSRTQRCERK